MSAIKEQLLTMVPELPNIIPKLSNDEVQQVINIFLNVQNNNEDCHLEKRAERRMKAIQSGEYTNPSGRSREDIDFELKEMRSDRI